MKRDAGENAVFFLSKKTAFTPASLFIFGQRTDLAVLGRKVLTKRRYKELKILRQKKCHPILAIFFFYKSYAVGDVDSALILSKGELLECSGGEGLELFVVGII